jgi:hypothetical protein
MKIELPETFSLPAVSARPGDPQTPVRLGRTGYVVLPDTWTGGDFEEFHIASTADEDDDQTVWDRMWAWANDRIIEWAIDGVPTNPNEIAKGEYLTWAVTSFLANSAIRAMNDYVRVDLEEVKESIDFPTTEDLKPSEFMAWHKAQDSLNGNKPMSSLLQSWNAGHQLVRAWPEGVDPKDYRKVDLRIMFAIDELMTEVILPSIHLGNWSAPPGEV